MPAVDDMSCYYAKMEPGGVPPLFTTMLQIPGARDREDYIHATKSLLLFISCFASLPGTTNTHGTTSSFSPIFTYLFTLFPYLNSQDSDVIFNNRCT